MAFTPSAGVSVVMNATKPDTRPAAVGRVFPVNVPTIFDNVQVIGAFDRSSMKTPMTRQLQGGRFKFSGYLQAGRVVTPLQPHSKGLA